MKTLVIAVTLVLGLAGAALAGDSDYDDPGMHFSPPPEWEKVLLAPPTVSLGDKADDDQDSDEARPVAVYAFHRGKPDQRTIAITVKHYDGPLDEFDRGHESDAHTGGDGVFIDKPIKMSLANGMPAYLLKVDQGSDAGHFTERYEYLIIDGTRGIVASYSGRQGDFTKQDAVDALASLYVVRYPRHQA